MSDWKEIGPDKLESSHEVKLGLMRVLEAIRDIACEDNVDKAIYLIKSDSRLTNDALAMLSNQQLIKLLTQIYV
jgi:hypothetical protein